MDKWASGTITTKMINGSRTKCQEWLKVWVEIKATEGKKQAWSEKSKNVVQEFRTRRFNSSLDFLVRRRYRRQRRRRGRQIEKMLLDQRGFRRRNENLRRRRKWGRKSFALSGTDAPSHCLGNEGEHIDLSLSEARPGQCKCQVGYSPLKGCRIMLTGICNKKDFHVRDKSSFPSSKMNRIDFNLGFFSSELSKLAQFRPV